MARIKKIFKALNDTFIVMLLFLFYVVGIGFGALIRSFFHRNRTAGSYWMPVEDKVELTSPY